MAAHNVVFPTAIAEGAQGGPRFKTSIVTANSGYEQRNIDWSIPLREWDVGHVANTPALQQDLLAFFLARAGRAHQFLFRDPSDYLCGASWTGGSLAHTGAHNFAVGDGIEDTFQITKVYTDAASMTFSRKITRLADPTRPGGGFNDGAISDLTPKIYVASVEESAANYTLNLDTGVLVFDPGSEPGVGEAVGWSGGFYVPARFDIDKLDFTLLSATVAELRSIMLVEVRE